MNWYMSESAIRPLETDTESSKLYNYVRKNIKEEKREDETVFVYDECKFLKESWGLYLDLAQAQADIDYLTMITEGL